MLKELYSAAIALAPKSSWPTYDGLELDRAEFLTSSEVSKCLRWTFFSKHQLRFPLPKGADGNNGFAARGHAVEAAFVEKIKLLETQGYRFEYLGADQRSFYDADIGLSGTPDGLMYLPDGSCYLLELKSIDPRFNKNNLPKKGHIPQTVQNMYLVQKCLGIKLAGGILFYIDASNLWDVMEFPVAFDQDLVELSWNRATELWDALEPTDLEPEGVFTGDCDLCPFTDHCSQAVGMSALLAKSRDLAGPFLASVEPSVLNAEEESTMETWLGAMAERKKWETAEDAVKKDVQMLVTEHGGAVITKGKTLVTAKMSEGRAGIDKVLLVAAGVDLASVTSQGKPFITLNVKESKK
jgi:CRISPR/Cas system-associated exonuclease Cas4 (RecB family)